MGKYLITGRQGTGKTTVIRALQKRGFAAYNTDDLPEASKLQNKQTGAVIPWPIGPVDWANYAWNWQEQPLKQLLESSKVVFIGAVVSNQEKYFELFDRIIVLTLDEATLRDRLDRHEHQSHHLPGEIERIVYNHEVRQAALVKSGDIIISSAKSLDEVVDEILSKTE